ncbi:sensor histidine kinase [Pseudomarimonas salicorniae]|uniref:histidine kinase n=1 Tax=Pseudomarimonas salicorniae TaxID=2933270 RepID=A0ABT0GH19_9GAMM|nr:ATP-binding protein [Lysobacter sp. CAU 1642]MCK7593325.1 ATP-binding protein [Lysobacter sp. CAU 1642]
MRLSPTRRTPGRFDRDAQQRELYFFTLYRCFQAALIALVVFSPVGLSLARLVQPVLAQVVCLTYLVLSAVFLLIATRSRLKLTHQVLLGLGVDILAALLMRAALEGVDLGIALLLIVNVGAGALLLPFRWGFLFATLAAVGVVFEYLVTAVLGLGETRASETAMLAVTYMAVAALCNILGRSLRESALLAAERGAEAASLAQINDLIIRRLRSGVIVVDAAHRVRLANETAWHLLGEPNPSEKRLEVLCPALSRHITSWRVDPQQEPQALQLRSDRPDVVPRIARLGTSEDLLLVFLDDSELVSRRAEQLTLSTLGRLSAGIAHEVRNPLGAISHAAQLLEESEALPDGDRQLLQIIVTQSQRVNGIINNVLALSRREASRPEVLEICEWLEDFLGTFCREHFLEAGAIETDIEQRPITAIFDGQQLHQVLTALLGNALRHGRRGSAPAEVRLRARLDDDQATPLIEVTDRGPGIRPEQAERIFEPFFTTHDMGSGLGLYIARQICEANQAVLEYRPAPEGGSCFRIVLSRPLRIV